jgi:hypothetical protein
VRTLSLSSSPGQVMWDLWWTKWHWGRFSQSTSVSPANSYSTDCSTLIIYHPEQVRSCGICGGQSGTGAGFLAVLRFPLPILIPPSAPHSSSIIRGWYNRPIVADVPSGHSLTPPQETKKRIVLLG